MAHASARSSVIWRLALRLAHTYSAVSTVSMGHWQVGWGQDLEYKQQSSCKVYLLELVGQSRDGFEWRKIYLIAFNRLCPVMLLDFCRFCNDIS
jgi:hypothetical protein